MWKNRGMGTVQQASRVHTWQCINLQMFTIHNLISRGNGQLCLPETIDVPKDLSQSLINELSLYMPSFKSFGDMDNCFDFWKTQWQRHGRMWRCTRALAEQLTIENVVDVLQLARLCDAPNLRLKCMNMLSKNFQALEVTVGWKFLQDHDPFLELEILQFIDESESVHTPSSTS